MDLSRRDERMIALAAQAAQFSNAKFHLGAVVAAKKAVGVGYNWNRNPPTIHWESAQCAEMRALRDAGPLATIGATVYVVRVNRDGQYRLARPCDNCQTQLTLARVSKVIYTIGSNEYGMMRLS